RATFDVEPRRRRARPAEAPLRHAGRHRLRGRHAGDHVAALQAGDGLKARVRRGARSMALEKLHSQRGTIAIVGAAESDELGKLPHKSALMLHAEGARNALDHAGIKPKEVDAVLSTGRQTANDVPEYLGIRPRYLDNTQMGGCSFIAHLQHALGLINAGVAEVVLITHGESGYSGVGMGGGDRFAPETPPGQWERPFGIGGAGPRAAPRPTRAQH